MTEHAVVGGGCFWCVEAALKEINAVEQVVSGYAGGSTENPTYDAVCRGRTGHAEVVRVVFDEQRLSYEELLSVFFAVHNPETVDREGPDTGSQYRSVVLFADEGQQQAAQKKIAELEQDGVYDDIVTELSALDTFYRAEEKHQDFYEKNPNYPYCQIHIPDKLSTVASEFETLT